MTSLVILKGPTLVLAHSDETVQVPESCSLELPTSDSPMLICAKRDLKTSRYTFESHGLHPTIRHKVEYRGCSKINIKTVSGQEILR